MGNFRPLALKCWTRFLAYMGYEYDRTKASHEHWKKPGYRTVTFWGNEKQVPPLHLKTCCTSMGCSLEDLYAWADKNC